MPKSLLLLEMMRTAFVIAILSWNVLIAGNALAGHLQEARFLHNSEEAVKTTMIQASEREALYDMLEGINSERDWRSSFPDMCLESPHGISCELEANAWHVVELVVGPVSDNSPACTADARIRISAVLRLTMLRSLAFVGCFLNSSASVSIPPALSELRPSLQKLVFQDNPGLVGGIPGELGQLESLERLVISRNGVRGTIPDELGGLGSLLQLDLSGNAGITGTIPASLMSQLSNLVVLDLRDNRLEGSIPATIGSLSRLRTLDLSQNALTGQMPASMGALTKLEFVDLNGNSISGGLPATLAGLLNLRDFALTGNPIGGELPAFLGNLSSLLTLRLSGAGFIAPIPEEVGRLRNLTVLDLSDNRLVGQIPASLGGLSRVYEMDLSGNLLSGPVPFSTHFVNRLGEKLIVRNNSGLCYGSALQSYYSSLDLPPCSDAPSATHDVKSPAPAADSSTAAPASSGDDPAVPKRFASSALGKNLGSASASLVSTFELVACCLVMSVVATIIAEQMLGLAS